MRKTREVLKASTIWLFSTLLIGGAMICVGKSGDREIPIMFICLSSVAFGIDIIFFYCVERYLYRIKIRVIKAVKSGILGKILTAATICAASALLTAILLEIASMFGDASISFKTLTILSVAVSAVGTIALYLFRAKGLHKKLEKEQHIGFLHGKAVLIWLPVKRDKNSVVALLIIIKN